MASSTATLRLLPYMNLSPETALLGNLSRPPLSGHELIRITKHLRFGAGFETLSKMIRCSVPSERGPSRRPRRVAAARFVSGRRLFTQSRRADVMADVA
jgi:hypothetical protein